MNSQKKAVILNEISFWKKNKLLPEHYCDFLMTLYLEGQEVEENNSTQLKINAANSLLADNYSKNWKMILAIIGIILIFGALFVLKAPFVLIPLILSIGIIVGLLIFLFKFKPNKTVRTTFTYATIALLIFGVSIKIVNFYFDGQPSLLYGVLLGNCILWLLTGRVLNLIYFKISGIIGLIIIIFYMLFI